MKTIFITGATGLVGSHLARKLLKDGYGVVALRRKTSKLCLLGDAANSIKWVEGDVRDIASLDEGMRMSDGLIHCAAKISFIPDEVEAMMQINVEGTANVMNSALLHKNIQRVLHISSVAAFGRPKGVSVIDEELDIKDSKDNFHYYRSKFLGEREVLRVHAEGLNVAIINPSTIFGGGYWDAEPNELFAKIHDGYSFYADGTNGFVDVRDVVHVGMKVFHSEYSGEKFLVTSENRSFKDVMWMIADEFGVKRPFLPAKKFLGEIAWRVDTLKAKLLGQRPLVTKEVIETAVSKFAFSNAKVIKAFDYKFIPVEQTIKDVCQLYKQSLAANRNYGYFEEF